MNYRKLRSGFSTSNETPPNSLDLGFRERVLRRLGAEDEKRANRKAATPCGERHAHEYFGNSHPNGGAHLHRKLAPRGFFDAVPTSGDAYILRNIIHDWEDDQAVAILTNCRRAMAAGARLVLVERYLATDPHEALLVRHADLEMLVNVGGRERTTDEYAALLARSGLRLTTTIALGTTPEAMGHQLIEARLA